MPDNYDPNEVAAMTMGIKSPAKKTTTETPDSEDLGPCASRPTPKWWTGIHVKRGRDGTRSFQYVHIGYEEFDPAGTRFVFEFNVPEKWRVTVTGTNLWKIYNYLHQHRLEWIEQADRSIGKDESVPLISKIDVEEIKPGKTAA
jgi:hypothetical protein